MKSIVITERLKEVINEFLGIEFIPACAIGSKLAYQNGSLVIKSFDSDNISGWRKLDQNGDLTNIITEFLQ